MNRRVIRNVAVFVFVVLISGWLGVLVDSVLTQPPKGETPGMGVWLLLPNLTGIALILLSKISWRELGYRPALKANAKWYLTSVLIFPAVTVCVLLLGAAARWIDLSAFNLRAFASAFGAALVVTFLNDIFEENLWRGFLTSQLLKLQLSDLKLYLLVGGVWGLWHVPYYLVFLPEATMRAVLPVSRAAFAAVSVVTMLCWAVMFIELFRATKSLWPCILCHAVEDALVNPLVLSGFIAIAPGKEILVSPIVGVIPSLLYLAIGLGMRAHRIRVDQMSVGSVSGAGVH